MFSLVLALHTPRGQEVFDSAHSRLRKKYFQIPKLGKIEQVPAEDELSLGDQQMLNVPGIEVNNTTTKQHRYKKRKRKNSSFVPDPAKKQEKLSLKVVSIDGGKASDLPCRYESLFGNDPGCRDLYNMESPGAPRAGGDQFRVHRYFLSPRILAC